MLAFAAVDAARLSSLAAGRGGIPLPSEWPLVLGILALVAFVGTGVLLAVGLTRLEALLVAGVAPLMVLVDAPIGRLAPHIGLGANLAGCVIPAFVAAKVLVERRAPWAESTALVGLGIVLAYVSSDVDPDRGVLLQYRMPAVVLGVACAGLLWRAPEKAGALGFAAGAIGVIVGADLVNLPVLASGDGAGRVVLGGAALLDGILLVAILSACIAAVLAAGLRVLVGWRAPSEPTV